MYDGIFMSPTCKINYVNMKHYYVDMRLIYVNSNIINKLTCNII